MAERALAAFVAGLSAGDVPGDVADRAALVVADTVGAILGGVSDEPVAALRSAWLTEGNGGTGATVLGSPGRQLDPYRAAFLNAAAGTVLELDEGHRFAAGHPAIHVLPALLADGEGEFRSGEALLTAFVAGYEAAVRVARAVGPLADGYHPHGVWGTVGTAAGVARLREYDAATTLAAMRIAANDAQHTRFAAATEGATVRNGYAGLSNLAGLVAADQAAAGFTGLANGVARHLAPAAAGDVDEAALAADLGERWEVETGYFKVHAACRYTHPVLDAIEALRSDRSLAPDDVASVSVATYPAAAALTETAPANALQAKFSIPFAVATALLTGETGKGAFAPEAITPAATALAERVDVAVADDLAARAPEERGARVTVSLADGETVEREVRAARGGTHRPFAEDELREKFRSLVAPVIGAERVAELWRAAREPAPPRVLCALTHG